MMLPFLALSFSSAAAVLLNVSGGGDTLLEVSMPHEAQSLWGTLQFASDHTNLCESGRLLPELYCLGPPKSGSTSLSIDLRATGIQPAGGTKEFSYFFNPQKYKGTRTDWLTKLPPCPFGRKAMLADYTPRYLLLPELPAMLHQFYGGSAYRLKFVIMLREPIHRYQSQYYMNADPHEPIPKKDVEPTFSKQMHADLANEHRGISTQALKGSMYAKYIHPYLKSFSAKQFLFIPLFEYVLRTEAVCLELGHLLHVTMQCKGAHAAHENARHHPSVQDDLSWTELKQLEAFFQPKNAELFSLLTIAHKEGAHLANYKGAVGSVEQTRAWLTKSW